MFQLWFLFLLLFPHNFSINFFLHTKISYKQNSSFHFTMSKFTKVLLKFVKTLFYTHIHIHCWEIDVDKASHKNKIYSSSITLSELISMVKQCKKRINLFYFSYFQASLSLKSLVRFSIKPISAEVIKSKSCHKIVIVLY